MKDKSTLDLELRLQAIEIVLAQIGKIAMITAGITPELAAQMRQNGREMLLNQTFPGADPAIADHLSAELADRVEALLGNVEYLVADALGKVPQGKPGQE